MATIYNKPSHDDLRKQSEIVYSLLSMLNENFDEPPLVALLHDKNLNGQQKESGDMSSTALEALMKLSFDDKQRQTICYLGGLQAIALMLEKSNKEFGCDSCKESVIKSRLHACMALTNLTFGFAKNKSLLCSIDNFVVTVVDQLKSPNEELRRVAASVLRNLSWKADADTKVILREAGIVSGLLTAAMEAEKESTLKCILDALWNVSAHSVENKAEICEFPGSLEFIVSLLKYLSSSIVENGGGILRNVSSHIAVHEEYRMILRQQNCFEILLKHLQSDNVNMVSNACGTLWNLSARCIEDQQMLWKLGAVRFLGNLVDSDHKAISVASSAALKNLLLYKSNTSSLFSSCSSSPIEEKGKENNDSNKIDNFDSKKLSSINKTINQTKNVLNNNHKNNIPIMKSQGFNKTLDIVSDRGVIYDVDDSLDEPIDFSTKFKEVNLENTVEPKEIWLNEFSNDKKLISRTSCDINKSINDTNSNFNVNNFTFPFSNVKDPRLVHDVFRHITNLCQSYKNNSGYSSPVENPKHYCTEDTPDGFSIANGSLCNINELSNNKSDYFPYTSTSQVTNFIAKNSLQQNKLINVHNQNILPNLNSSKLTEFYEGAKDEPIDFSTKYQEILPDKYPTRFKWSNATTNLYKEPIYGNPIVETSAIMKEQSNPLKTGIIVEKNNFHRTIGNQNNNVTVLENKNLINTQTKSSISNSCSPNDVPKQYCTEDTPIGYSRASSLSSLSMKSSELEHVEHVKTTIDKNAETLPSIQENETLNITPHDNKNTSQSSKSTGKSSGSSGENNSRHNSGPGTKTVTFDETNQTPMMFSRCSSLGSLSSFDARSVHSSVVSEYSRRASGIVSPSDLPDSPGDTMPPSPKNVKQNDHLNNCQTNSEKIQLPVNYKPGMTITTTSEQQQNDMKNDSDCSLSDNEDDCDDDLLSEIIEAAMPKNRKHSRVTYEVVNQYSNSHRVKMMMMKKPFTPNNAIDRTLIFQQHNPHDLIQDTIKTYADEGTPLEISRFTSLSDLSVDESLAAGKIIKKDAVSKVTNLLYQKSYIENAIVPCDDDSLKNYHYEGTPINFSRNDSLSSLGSKDFSSPRAQKDVIIHPKLKKFQIFLKSSEDVHPLISKNVTSTPCSKNHGALGDEILRYAVEGTPDKVPPISYDDENDKTVNDVNSMSNLKNEQKTTPNMKTKNLNSYKNECSSSSSLSFDSDDSIDDDDSPIKDDLLQECINAALPKGKNRKNKNNTTLRLGQMVTTGKHSDKIISYKGEDENLKNVSVTKIDAETTTKGKTQKEKEPICTFSTSTNSLKKAVYVTNAIHEVNANSEEDDYSASGPSTEANNTVIYRGPNGVNNEVDSKEDATILGDVLLANLNSIAISREQTPDLTNEDENKQFLNDKTKTEVISANKTTTFPIDKKVDSSSRSLNFPGLIVTEENFAALNLSPSLLSKSADPILASENYFKEEPNDDFRDVSDLIDNFYLKTCLQELESSRFHMKQSRNNNETQSDAMINKSEVQSSLNDFSLSSDSSISNSLALSENGNDKKLSKNKILNFFRKHSIKKPKTATSQQQQSKKSELNFSVADPHFKKSHFAASFGKSLKKK